MGHVRKKKHSVWGGFCDPNQMVVLFYTLVSLRTCEESLLIEAILN